MNEQSNDGRGGHLLEFAHQYVYGVVGCKSGAKRTVHPKRYETYRNPKYTKAVRGRTALQKRHEGVSRMQKRYETSRNPKYTKAVRGRTAIQNF